MLPLLFAMLQSGDPRLDVKATLLQPHATYAELGAWVQKATGAPVYVVPAIQERKATVLVEDRPVREVMDRTSEALWVEWERTKEGYTLRLDPTVAAEEARYARAEADAWKAGLLEILGSMAEVGRLPADRLKEEYDAANAEADRLGKDKVPEDQGASDAARNRADRIGRALYGQSDYAADVLLASVSSDRREAILDGRPLLVADRTLPDLGAFPPGLRDAMKAMHLQADAPILFGVEYRPETGELRVVHAQPEPNGASSSWLPIKGDESPAYNLALADEPLRKRLNAFVAVRDKALLATRIAPDPRIRPEPTRPTPYRSLADELVPLHRRTGLPIVADGYRVALVAHHEPEGTDVAAWLQDLSSTAQGFRGPRPNLRAANGWLMFRQFRDWKQVGREIPEAPIRALEAAYRRSGGATLDDYATFAKRVTPAQEPFLGGADLVMDAPYQAIEGNVPFLRLWAALPEGLRREAFTESGLALAPISSSFGDLTVACVAGKLSLTSASQALLPYVLSRAPALPEALRLYVSQEPVASMDFPDMVSGEGYTYNPTENRVPGARATLRVPDAASFASYEVPFGPAVPIKPEKARFAP